MLEGLNLTDKFRDIPSNRRGKNFHCLNDAIRINNEASPDIDTTSFIVNTVSSAYASPIVRKERVRHSAFHHFGQFSFLPYLMGETAINTDSKYLCIESLQLGILDGNCRQFSWSDKGKVTWIET